MLIGIIEAPRALDQHNPDYMYFRFYKTFSNLGFRETFTVSPGTDIYKEYIGRVPEDAGLAFKLMRDEYVLCTEKNSGKYINTVLLITHRRKNGDTWPSLDWLDTENDTDVTTDFEFIDKKYFGSPESEMGHWCRGRNRISV